MHDIEAKGANMPALGFGTFRLSAAEVAEALPAALKLGFRHVDAAQIYNNEEAVGVALKASGVGREEIFLTTKVWITEFAPERFEASVAESLRKLGTDHVDLLLLHWPRGSEVPREVQIAELNKVHARGMTRHIGVSNYNIAQMREAMALSDASLVTNQVEYHPWLGQQALLSEIRTCGMALTAYFAMAKGRSATDPLLADIGSAHGKSAAQVALRWLVQQENVAALTKTARPERLAENLAIFDFALSPEEMASISGLARPDGRIVLQPEFAPDWD